MKQCATLFWVVHIYKPIPHLLIMHDFHHSYGKIMCQKHENEKLNNMPCAEASVPILNTSNIVLYHGEVMYNFILGGSSGN